MRVIKKEMVILGLLISSLLIGCTYMTNQKQIHLVDSKITMSKACEIWEEDMGYCLKRKEIRMSHWKVEEFKGGYIVTAVSIDEFYLLLGVGHAIFYVFDDEVSWVNRVADRISWADEVDENLKEEIIQEIKRTEQILERHI